MEITLLIIPGLGDSGQEHWQTYWLRKFNNSVKVLQNNWDAPLLEDWITTLDKAIQNIDGNIVLVAHSLAVSLVLHWTKRYNNPKVIAALLVAPADVDSPDHTPEEVRNFAPMPLHKLPFPATVIGSTNDPFASLQRVEYFAKNWGSNFLSIGAKGHINTASKLEYWEEGQEILEQLLVAVK